jgi:sensor c-di-GMP phosphodiesterase-like protein
MIAIISLAALFSGILILIAAFNIEKILNHRNHLSEAIQKKETK